MFARREEQVEFREITMKRMLFPSCWQNPDRKQLLIRPALQYVCPGACIDVSEWD